MPPTARAVEPDAFTDFLQVNLRYNDQKKLTRSLSCTVSAPHVHFATIC